MTRKANVQDLARPQGLLGRLHRTARSKHLFVCLKSADVVELPQVDMIGVQLMKALLQVLQSGGGRPSTCFGGKDDVVSTARSRLSDALLARAITSGCINKVNPRSRARRITLTASSSEGVGSECRRSQPGNL